MAVSYASPTYYADRLCERAALYMKNIQGGLVPWQNPRLRNVDGSFSFDGRVQEWFEGLEKRYYLHRERQGVPAWGKYAPWGSGVAETMFWM